MLRCGKLEWIALLTLLFSKEGVLCRMGRNRYGSIAILSLDESRYQP